jgi:hypothetical protein
MMSARAALAEWNPYARLTIRRTRRLSPSCCALLIPSRTAAKIPDRRLRIVCANGDERLQPAARCLGAESVEQDADLIS